LSPEAKARNDLVGSCIIIDACRPFHWRDRFPKVNMPSREKEREGHKKFDYLLR
jgi:4-hydroxy-3-polyprenylbenzoate decarboxylase